MARTRVIESFSMASLRFGYSLMHTILPTNDDQPRVVEGRKVKMNSTKYVFSDSRPRVSWNTAIKEMMIRESRDNRMAALRNMDEYR